MIDIDNLVTFITLAKQYNVVQEFDITNLTEKDALINYLNFIRVEELKDIINNFFDNSNILINNFIVNDFVKLIYVLISKTDSFISFLHNSNVSSVEGFESIVLARWPSFSHVLFQTPDNSLKISFKNLIEYYILNDTNIAYVFTNLNQYIKLNSVNELIEDLNVN